MISIKTILLNHKQTIIAIMVLMFGFTLAYAQYSSIGKIDAEDRLEITEKAEVIKNINISDPVEVSEKTELQTTFQDSR